MPPVATPTTRASNTKAPFSSKVCRATKLLSSAGGSSNKKALIFLLCSRRTPTTAPTILNRYAPRDSIKIAGQITKQLASFARANTPERLLERQVILEHR